ncbi:hypothetical protein BD408DRAFT_431541 [Parasitella parasitica]|nr:hypothetical protein BD408DRAFT_431541 [Parasitella parasitica]
MKPQLAQFINKIYLSYMDDLNLPLQKLVLDLALTPNIKYFQGKMSQTLFNHFLGITQHKSSKFDRLQALPKLYTTNNKYFDAMLHFKDSLRELSVSFLPFEISGSSQSIVTRLDEFKSLNKLALDLYGLACSDNGSTNFMELENILNKCKHLEILEFTWGSTVECSMEKAEFKKWLSSKVKQVSSLRIFKVGKLEDPHMIEYLVYKYPNVSKATITYLENSSKRIVDAVKDISTVQLIVPDIFKMEHFKDLLLDLKSPTNQVKIQHHSDSFWQGLLDVTKCSNTGVTTFNFQIHGHVPPVCKDTISFIGSFEQLETNYIGYSDSHQSEKSLVDKLNDIIPFDSLDKLTSLEFLCDEEISEALCEKVAQSAPNLRHLTINTCCSYEKGHYCIYPFLKQILKLYQYLKRPARKKSILTIKRFS